MTTFLWIGAIFVVAIIGLFAAAIAAGSGQESRYEEGFRDGQMAERQQMQKKLEKKYEEGFQGGRIVEQLWLQRILKEKLFRKEGMKL